MGGEPSSPLFFCKCENTGRMPDLFPSQSRKSRILPESFKRKENSFDSPVSSTTEALALPTSGPIVRVPHLPLSFRCTQKGDGVLSGLPPFIDVCPNSTQIV